MSTSSDEQALSSESTGFRVRVQGLERMVAYHNFRCLESLLAFLSGPALNATT